MTFLQVLCYSKYLTKLLCTFMFNKTFVIVIVIVNINKTLPSNKTKYITIYSNSTESKMNFRNDIASKTYIKK